MAQRYGGKYSPEAKSGHAPQDRGSFRGASRTRVGGRVNFLFIVPLPLIWKAFTSPPTVMVQYLIALGLLILSAWMTREGLLAQEAYDARKIARRPALPRKSLGSLLTGLGLGLAGFAGFGVVEAAIFAMLGVVLHGFSFGLDPLGDKGMEGVDLHQSDRVARAVEQAEDHLRAMSDAIRHTGNRQLETRVENFQTVARDLFRTIEEDPRDLTAARKYLSVYLRGARDATVKFSDLYARTPDEQARADFEALLTDLEENFAARTRKLLLDDRSDLTVEIDVLRERLQREGIRLDNQV